MAQEKKKSDYPYPRFDSLHPRDYERKLLSNHVEYLKSRTPPDYAIPAVNYLIRHWEEKLKKAEEPYRDE